MKNIKVFILPLLYVILGLLLLAYSEPAVRAVYFVLCAAAVAAGIINIALYLMADAEKNFSRNSFCIGLLMIISGVMAFFKYSFLVNYVPVVLGGIIIVNGAMELQDALDVYRMHIGNELAVLLIAAVNLIIGVVLTMRPSDDIARHLMIAGACLLVSGITDFAASMAILVKIKKQPKEKDIMEKAPDMKETAGGSGEDSHTEEHPEGNDITEDKDPVDKDSGDSRQP